MASYIFLSLNQIIFFLSEEKPISLFQAFLETVCSTASKNSGCIQFPSFSLMRGCAVYFLSTFSLLYFD